MKTSYIVIVLIIGFGFGIFINPSSAAAQEISPQDAVILNAQLETMKIALLELQKQQTAQISQTNSPINGTNGIATLQNALDNLKNTLESIKAKSQNQEIALKNQQALNETLAGVKINLVAINLNINPNIKSKNSSAISKKKISSIPISTAPIPENQTVAKQKVKENPSLMASIESATTKSTSPSKSLNSKKIIFGIISLAILLALGYFSWMKKDYLTALFKAQKDKTLTFSKIQKEKVIMFLKSSQEKIKTYRTYKEKSA